MSMDQKNTSDTSGINQIEDDLKRKKSALDSKERGHVNIMKRHPKAFAVLGAIATAALVIGMIATFGGVGMIDLAILGKTALALCTAGAAALTVKKGIDAYRGGSSERANLKNLERQVKKFKQLDHQEKLDKLSTEIDKKLVESLIGKGYDKDPSTSLDDSEITIKDKSGRSKVLSPQQSEIFRKIKKDEQDKLRQKDDKISELSADIKDINKLLHETQTKSLDSQLELFFKKFDLSYNSKATDDNKAKLLDDVADKIKKSDDSALDQDQKKELKSILAAAMGVKDNGKAVVVDGQDFIDLNGRQAIKTALNDKIDFSSPNPKLKTTDVTSTLSELSSLVTKEKAETVKRNSAAKSASR